MGIPLYLAMTAAEYRSCPPFPERIAWMACHFSPYGTGLCNLPEKLPAGSLLILNDRTPIHGHDAEQIGAQLEETAGALNCSGVLLDFQRPSSTEAAQVAAHLVKLPCPVAVSDLYAREMDCPVFLSAPPTGRPLKEYLSSWKGKEIWLEAALGGQILTLTEMGCTAAPLPVGELPDCPLAAESLHLRYRIDREMTQIRFTLQRTLEDLDGLLLEAESLGVKKAIGLYQELGFQKNSGGS